jgi:hypothetical protein
MGDAELTRASFLNPEQLRAFYYRSVLMVGTEFGVRTGYAARCLSRLIVRNTVLPSEVAVKLAALYASGLFCARELVSEISSLCSMDLKIRLIYLRRSRPARLRRAAGAQHAEPGASPAPSGSGNIRVTGTAG